MLKRSACLVLVCVLLVLSHTALAASTLAGLTLVVVDAPDIAALHRARALVHENGGRIGVMVPPSIMIGWIDPATAGKLVGKGGIRDIRWTETAAKHHNDRRSVAVRHRNLQHHREPAVRPPPGGG
jgi:hypothetical protein